MLKQTASRYQIAVDVYEAGRARLEASHAIDSDGELLPMIQGNMRKATSLHLAVEEKRKRIVRTLWLATIPDDTLKLIFEFTSDVTPLRAHYHSPRRRWAVRLSSVCMRFRSIAKSVPQFWNEINIEFPYCPTRELVTVLHSRSKSTGINLYINGCLGDYEWLLSIVAPDVVSFSFYGITDGLLRWVRNNRESFNGRMPFERLESLGITWRQQALGWEHTGPLRESSSLLAEFEHLSPRLTDVYLCRLQMPKRAPSSVETLRMNCDIAKASAKVLPQMSLYQGQAQITLDVEGYDKASDYKLIPVPGPEPSGSPMTLTWQMTHLRLHFRHFVRDFTRVHFPVLEELHISLCLQHEYLVEVGPKDGDRVLLMWSDFLRLFFVGDPASSTPKTFPKLRSVGIECKQDGREGMFHALKDMPEFTFSGSDVPARILLTGSFFANCPVLESLTISLIDHEPSTSNIGDFELPLHGLKTLTIKDSNFGELTAGTLREYLGIGIENEGSHRLFESLVLSNCKLPPSSEDIWSAVQSSSCKFSLDYSSLLAKY